MAYRRRSLAPKRRIGEFRGYEVLLAVLTAYLYLLKFLSLYLLLLRAFKL